MIFTLFLCRFGLNNDNKNHIQKIQVNICDLAVGTEAVLEGFSTDSPFTRRLQEMGLIPGTIIRLIRKSPFKGPIEIAFGYTRMAFRPYSEDKIFVTELFNK